MALKALEILKSFKSVAGCREAFIGYSNRQNIYEAIAELEALENRKCTNCKFFTKNNAFYGVCAKDVNTTKNQDEWLSNIEFSCNRFEQKEN